MGTRRFSPGRVARWSARHAWAVLALWVVAAVAVTIIGGRITPASMGDDFTNNPDSVVGERIMGAAQGTPENASDTVVIVSERYTVADPEFRQMAERFESNLAPFANDIVAVTTWYDDPSSPVSAQFVSQDQHALLIHVTFTGTWSDYQDRFADWKGVLDASRADGFEIASIGDVSAGEIGELYAADMSRDTSVGLPVAAIVLIVVFGALVAAALPLLLGIFTIVTGLGLATILGGWLPLADVATMMVSMIGLAIGIDYSLIVVERFREERKRGRAKLDAVEIAWNTAGKAVIFSGGTVLLALLALLIMPMTTFQGIGVATGITVLVAVFGTLTLLPAMIGLCGDWINFPRFGLIRALKRQDETGVVDDRLLAAEKRGLWGRIADFVMRRPHVFAIGTTALLLLIASPLFTMRLGQPSVAVMPESNYRRGFERISEHFPMGQDAPVFIVVDNWTDTDQAAMTALQNAIAGDPRFAEVTVTPAGDGHVMIGTVVLTVDPNSSAASEAIADLRNTLIPNAFGDQESRVYVAGQPASIADFNTLLEENLPLVFGFVLALIFLLLMLAFRSLVLPLVSIVMNLLSVGAAYGLVVAIFQHGWGADLLGLKQVDTIVNYLPVMLFCILFGLSMDYQVFLLSRIKEGWDTTHDNTRAIASGVQSTGHIITGAALIMVAVFLSFAFGDISEMQQMGIGLGFAVLMDATIVRSILVPATLRLIGERNWAFPRALGWLPELHIEGAPQPVPVRVRD